MSWVDDRLNILVALNNLSYVEIAVDEQIEEQPFATHQHFYYNLKKIGSEGISLTSNSASFTHKVSLEIFYINNQSHTRDYNADSFDTAVSSIVSLAQFRGEIDNNFEDIDEDHGKGIFNFLFGFETC